MKLFQNDRPVEEGRSIGSAAMYTIFPPIVVSIGWTRGEPAGDTEAEEEDLGLLLRVQVAAEAVAAVGEPAGEGSFKLK